MCGCPDGLTRCFCRRRMLGFININTDFWRNRVGAIMDHLILREAGSAAVAAAAGAAEAARRRRR